MLKRMKRDRGDRSQNVKVGEIASAPYVAMWFCKSCRGTMRKRAVTANEQDII